MSVANTPFAIVAPQQQHQQQQQQPRGFGKLSRRFSKEFSPHLPSTGAQNMAKHANGTADLSNAEFMRTPTAGVAG